MLKKMNLPNKLTMLRIILVPIFILILCIPSDVFKYVGYVALVVFAVAAITDFLDGRISRKNNIVTKFGKIMDPLADKLLVSAGFIMLTGLGIIPGFVTAIVVFRDFFVTALRTFGSDNAKDVSAGLSGKIKTLFQMLTIVFALLNFSLNPSAEVFAFINTYGMSIIEVLANVCMSISLVCALVTTIWSFVDYFNRFKEDIDVEN